MTNSLAVKQSWRFGEPPVSDPVRALQSAARQAASHVCPGVQVERVVLIAVDGKTLLDVAVPAGAPNQDEPELQMGWKVTDRRAFFDGKSLLISASRLKLLKVLLEADGPLAGKEIAKLAFSGRTDEDGARFHIRKLREELKAALDYDGDPIPGDGGYRMVL